MPPKILIIPGSLRTGSHNARLAALAAKELVLADAEVTQNFAVQRIGDATCEKIRSTGYRARLRCEPNYTAF